MRNTRRRNPIQRLPRNPAAAPAHIPPMPPAGVEYTRIFCADLPPPASPHRRRPAGGLTRLRVLRRRTVRTISPYWDAYKTASAILTTALLLILLGLAIYKQPPAANPPQSGTHRTSPYPYPGSPFAVAEFE